MFVTFEGVDGSGKSTQAALLVEHLTSLRTRGRSDARAGRHAARREDSRALLLDGDEPAPWTEAALFAAARAEFAERVIRPALEAAATSSATASSTPRSPIRVSRVGSASTACWS